MKEITIFSSLISQYREEVRLGCDGIVVMVTDGGTKTQWTGLLLCGVRRIIIMTSLMLAHNYMSRAWSSFACLCL